MKDRATDGSLYEKDELDFDFSYTPDYWEKLKHQYAGMAMQAILSSNVMMEILSRRDNGTMEDEVAMEANDYATALVEKLKSENNGQQEDKEKQAESRYPFGTASSGHEASEFERVSE